MKKIKILHFSQVGGGVDRYLRLYLKYSDKSQFENVVIGTPSLNKDDYIDKTNKFYQLDISQSFSPFKLLKNIFLVRKILNQEAPDILYLHSTFAGVIGRIAAIGLKCKVVYNPHGWSFKMNVSPLKKKVYAFIEKILSLLTDKLILISKSEYQSAKDIGIRSDKLSLVYNGIEITVSNQIASLPIDISDKYVIGMIGRLSEQKNPLFFLEFAREILRLYPDTYFIMVGDGELRNIVEQKINEYALGKNILITGWVNNPEMYLNLFDQAVLFSKWEGFGLAVAEYMMYKKPTIITNIDGMVELITSEKSGFIIELNDLPDAIKKSSFIRNNEKVSKKFVEVAYHKVCHNFNIVDKVREMENIFKNILEK